MPNEDEADALILGAKVTRNPRRSNQPAIPMPDISTPGPTQN
jgi:hypothetical protein